MLLLRKKKIIQKYKLKLKQLIIYTSLSHYQGKKLVLYFYPKDSTSGCTAEACSLRDNYAALRKQGYELKFRK